MKKNLIKIITLLGIVGLTGSMCTEAVQAEVYNNMKDTNSIQNAVSTKDYDFDATTGTLLKYKSFDENVKIPTQINGVKVKYIGAYTFSGPYSNFDKIKSIEIPDGIVEIGNNAFSACCNLEEIDIPDSVLIIKDNAFSNCRTLKSISIPASVTTIGEDAFSSCTRLEEIFVHPNNKNYSSSDGILFNKRMTELIKCPPAKTEEQYNIPNSVNTIKCRAFGGCRNLTEIKIPDTVTSIEKYAFSACDGLTELELPKNIKSIEDCLFYRSTSLENIEIPQGVTKIGWRAFCGCSNLKSVKIPKSVTIVDNSLFERCNKLTNIYVENELTKKLLIQTQSESELTCNITVR